MTALPAVTVTVPPLQVPDAAAPMATRLAGSVSVKLKVWVGLPVGWVMVKVKLVVPPTVKLAAKALLTVGAAAMTDTQAPALGVTPDVALGVIAAVMLAVVLILLLALVLAFGASVQAPTFGVVLVVIGTIMVQVAVAFNVIQLVKIIFVAPAPPAVVPAVQVPVTAAPLATKPVGKVSVKVKVCAGFKAG